MRRGPIRERGHAAGMPAVARRLDARARLADPAVREPRSSRTDPRSAFSILTRGRRIERYDRRSRPASTDGAEEWIEVPYDTVRRASPLGRTGLRVTRLGFGGASIGGLFRPVDDDDAIAVVRARLGRSASATSTSRRSTATAPPSAGSGAGLAGRPRDEFVLSTKVGRLVRADRRRSRPAPTSTARRSTAATTPSTRTPRAAASCSTTAPTASAARSRRASSGSGSTGSTSRYIHDPDDHWQAAIDGRYPALAPAARGRASSGAIGAGMNQSAMLARFAREADIDVVPARRPLHAARPGGARRAPAALRRARHRGARRRRDEQRRPGRPAARRARSTTRPAPARDRRARPAASRRPASGTASRCAPRRSSSRSPIRPWPGSIAGVRTDRPPRRVPGAAAASRSRPACGTSCGRAASSPPAAPVPAAA